MLAQVLGMNVVAEGVETKEQLKILRDLHCEYGQGYYFSRPSNAADAEKIIVETDERLVKSRRRDDAPKRAVPEQPVKSVAPAPPSFSIVEPTPESSVKTLEPLDLEEEEFLEALILLEESQPVSAVKTISPFVED